VPVCQFLHVHKLMFESRASHAIDSLGVARVLIDIRQVRKTTVCEKKRNRAICNKLISDKRNEYFKPFCTICQPNREIGHLFFM
jgi:hypothetical protein